MACVTIRKHTMTEPVGAGGCFAQFGAVGHFKARRLANGGGPALGP